MSRRECFRLSPLYLYLSRRGKRSLSVEYIYIVFLHQEVDSLCVLIYHRLFALDHFSKIHHDIPINFYPMRNGMFVGILQEVRRVQERFRRDTAHVEASSSEGVILLYNCGFLPQLRGANSRYIAPWACSYNNNIVIFHYDTFKIFISK